MIPKSGHRFSEKIMLKLKSEALPQRGSLFCPPRSPLISRITAIHFSTWARTC
jgi:hypothetical protein